MNILIWTIFFILSALILISGIMVVTVQNIIYAALWLIASFFGVGALYLLLEAEFIAVVQILIYVGAISILIIMAIMLTPDIRGESVRQLYQRWRIAFIIAAAMFGVLIVPTVLLHPWHIVAPTPTGQATPLASTQRIGAAFMREYLLPFEVASVLLLVALIGAIVIVYEDRSRRRRILTLAEEIALRKQQEPGVRDQESEVRDQDSWTRDQGPGVRDQGQVDSG